jgi:DNA-binding IscR family transcriptional regulator
VTIEIALNTRGRPVGAKSLARQHRLSPRYLEPVLQALMQHGILKSKRGARRAGPAREQRRIAANDTLRAAGTDAARCRGGFDPALFCAAPMPNQKRSLSIGSVG